MLVHLPRLVKALVAISPVLSQVIAQETGKTQVAVTADSHTFTAIASYGDVILEAQSTTATIDPGQYARFQGISVSAVPERTAIVVDGTQTYGFTRALDSSLNASALPIPSAFGGMSLPAAIITASDGASVTVSAIPNSYVIEGASTSTTISAGQDVTVAGARISALSNSIGVVANSFTFTLAAASSTPAPVVSGSRTSSADTTLITGTHTSSSSSSRNSAGAGSDSSSPSSSSSATSASSTGGAVTFTSGDLGIVGWLASSIGMLVFAFGL